MDKWNVYKPKGRNKILALSDLHVPLHNRNHVDMAFQAGLDNGCRILVLNGDLLELEQLSGFGRQHNTTIIEDAKTLFSILIVAVPFFDRVYITWGNHEFRLVRHFRKRVDITAHFIVKDKRFEILGKIISDVRKETGHKHIYYNGGPWGRMLQIGDCVFSHPDAYFKQPCRTPKSVYDKVLHRDDKVRAVVVGHTHHLYMQIREFSKHDHKNKDHLLMETGCLCGMGDFAKEGMHGVWHPGCGIISQENGKTIFGECEIVSL